MEEILNKILVSILALLILNCSVEMPHPSIHTYWDGEDYVEDLSFNDIESIYELVTECWMGLKDHVPEAEDEDSDEIKTGGLFDWIINNTTTSIKQAIFPVCDINSTKYNNEYYYLFSSTCIQPPDLKYLS